jgi:hypothetical protein
MPIGSELHNMRRTILGLSIDSVAELSSINVRRLTPYFAGIKGLPNVELERLEALLNDLTKLAEYAAPFVLPKNTQLLVELLGRLKSGEFEQAAKARQ